MKHNDNNIRMKGKAKAPLLSPFSFSFLVRKKNSFHKKPTAMQ